MSKQTITAGESWTVRNGQTVVTVDQKRIICDVHAGHAPERLQYAQAIAAVPDMIEALRQIRDITYKHHPVAATELAKATAKAALRKAGQID